MATAGPADQVSDFIITISHAGNPQVHPTRANPGMTAPAIGLAGLVSASASRSLTVKGRMEVAVVLGVPQAAPGGPATRSGNSRIDSLQPALTVDRNLGG